MKATTKYEANAVKRGVATKSIFDELPMIIEHYGIKVEVPPMQFGNEFDVRIRDEIEKIGDLTRRRKTPIPNAEKKVKEIMKTLQYLVNEKRKETLPSVL